MIFQKRPPLQPWKISQEQAYLLFGTQLAPGTATSRALRKQSSSYRARALNKSSRASPVAYAVLLRKESANDKK